MTKLRRSLSALLMVSSIGLSNIRTLAQDEALMPAELNQRSSLSEIVNWLNRTSFGNARVVLKDSWDTGTYRPPWGDDEPAKHTFVFTQGFKLTNIDGCTLALRNDDVRIVPTSLKMEDSKDHLVAELNLPLNRLSPTKGRRTYRFTKDPEKVRLLGAWRTEFKYKGLFSRTIVGLTLHSADSKEPGRWEGQNLAFTFDSKEMSEKFDAAFRQAIRLCRSK